MKPSCGDGILKSQLVINVFIPFTNSALVVYMLTECMDEVLHYLFVVRGCLQFSEEEYAILVDLEAGVDQALWILLYPDHCLCFDDCIVSLISGGLRVPEVLPCIEWFDVDCSNIILLV